MDEISNIPVREQALQLVQTLPADATWDELMYRIYVRQAVDRGIQDSNEDRVVDVAEVRRQFGLAP